MRQKLRGIVVVRLALLLLVTIVGVGTSGYTLRPAHAASPSITSAKDSPISSVTRTIQEPDTSIIVAAPDSDAGGIGAAGGFFPIKASLSYTLDVPNGIWHAPELFPGPPVIRNIRQNVYVFGAQAGYQSFNLKITSSVEVYNASGTLLKTVTGSPAGGIAAPGDTAYSLEDDSTSIPTTTPYQPPSSGFAGPYNPTTLFILKHIVYVTADYGYNIRPSSHVPTYKVDSFR